MVVVIVLFVAFLNEVRIHLEDFVQIKSPDVNQVINIALALSGLVYSHMCINCHDSLFDGFELCLIN